MSNWISVNDSLPKIQRPFTGLIVCISVDYEAGVEAWYHNDGSFYWDYDDVENQKPIGRVNHWQYMPEAPKRSEDEQLA